MKMQSLEDVMTEELKDMYSAENQILKALPKMAKAAEGDLRTAFEKHLQQTRTHVERLEKVADEMGISPKGKKCMGMEGLLEEGSEVMSEEGEEKAKEAAMIGAAQRVEHYEIAAYGTARTHARQLGMEKAAKLFEQTLAEEKLADELLTQIAESRINPEASMAANGHHSQSSMRRR